MLIALRSFWLGVSLASSEKSSAIGLWGGGGGTVGSEDDLVLLLERPLPPFPEPPGDRGLRFRTRDPGEDMNPYVCRSKLHTARRKQRKQL